MIILYFAKIKKILKDERVKITSLMQLSIYDTGMELLSRKQKFKS